MEYNVIDADGHVLEPPDLWENYIEPKFREYCPKLLVTEDGREVLRIEGDDGIDLGRGKKPLKLGGLGTFGARTSGVKSFRVPYLDGKPGGFDPHARIPDMDAEGIDAAFLYPSLGLFSWRHQGSGIFGRCLPRVQPLAGGLLQALSGSFVWRRDAADAIRRPPG